MTDAAATPPTTSDVLATGTGAAASTTPASRMLPLAIGVGGGILGLVPWLIGGGRLPLQNLWATATMPDAMPFALLPVSQYFATTLFSLVLLGGVFAGLAVRAVGRRRSVAGWPAAVGVGIVHVVAIGQSLVVLADGLALGRGGDPRASVYFAGMLAIAILASLFAQLALWMTGHRSVAVAALGVALAAVPFGTWLVQGVLAPNSQYGPGVGLAAFWTPAVVVGAALIWCGVRPPVRLVVWVAALLALWILPALFTAVQYGLGMRVLQGDVAEMAAAAIDVFPAVLREVWMPVAGAFAIGAVGTGVREALRAGPRGATSV